MPRSKPPYARLWLVVLTGAALAAALVQLVVLPHLLPAIDGGHGLLVATDSLDYHREAILLAERIRASGWHEWRLLPQGHAMIGIPAAIYAVTLPAPWVMIPFSAAAHAFAALLLMRIMMHFTDDWRLAALAALPFAAFPSAMFWYTQLLKDGYFALGLMLFLSGWVAVADPKTARSGLGRPLLGIAAVAAGFALMALMRVYALTLMYVDAFILAAVAVLFLVLAARRRLVTGRQLATATLFAFVAIVAMAGIRESLVETNVVAADAATVADRADYGSGAWKAGDSPLPAALERPLLTLSGIRGAYLDRTAGASSIDFDRRLESAPEILGYIPRALQIGYFAPFPDRWFAEGSTGATTLMRRVSMAEMLIVYAALACLPLAVWRWRRSGPFWVILACSASLIAVFAIATPNVGTLYRIRYGFLMPVVGLGLLAAAEWLRARRRGATDGA